MKSLKNKYSIINDNKDEQRKNKTRILFVGHDYSTCSGGAVINRRNLHLLKEYFGQYNVYEFNLTRAKNKYLNLLRLIFFKIHGVGFSTKKELKKIIDDKNDIKYVFCNESALGLFPIKFIKDNNFITFFHNAEATYYESKLAATWDALSKKGKIYELYEKNAVNVVEKRNCLYSAMNICLNNRDSDELKRLYGRGADLILPSSMEDTYRKYDESEIPNIGDYLLFVGSDFYGNTEGLFDFIENCLPSINCKLVIVGNGMDRYRNKFDTDKAEFVGFVEDIGPYYAGAKAVVLPIISGSGMKTKTCEALMHGKIIFGTDEAFEGFDHINEADCVLCNSHSEFINKINDFIKNDKTSDPDSNFSSKSRVVFEKYYSNEAVFKLFKDKMDNFVKCKYL